VSEAGAEVWVAQAWQAHGHGCRVQGAYDSREAAFDGLKAEPGMTVYVAGDGLVHGKPRNEDRRGAEWALARPVPVKGKTGT
jgi:RecB family exonuclease